MKTLKNCIAVCILLATVTACKDEKSLDELPVETNEVAESPVQVVVDMVVPEDDILEIFYTEDGSLDFGPKSVRVDVPGKPESQLVVFEMPEDAHLTSIRFDVGQNPEQKEMTINKFIVKQHDKEIELSGADFFTHFNVTDYIKATPATFSFKTVKVKDNYDPFFYGNSSLMGTLKALE